ncbi:MAG: glycosyltransferase [Candidatus Dormibacteraeota bacterium]|nr:glycosyltransferase [Candidatus Dormibacteraeota bacterium]
MVRIACDTSRLDLQRPAGPAVYALAVLEALRSTGQAEIIDATHDREAEVILSLDGRFRARPGRRTVTAILDLGHLLERGGYTPRTWLAQNWRVASASRRSDHLLAPSGAVQVGLERYLGVPAERITVFEARPAPEFRRRPRDEVEALRRRFGLPERYLLFVGSRSRRKNLGLLARAWEIARRRLASESGGELGLVLAGPGRGGVAGARDLGYVDRALLPPLLSGALAWVNPSLYEGSAVGALEAVSCGAPPLVAATGASPRAVGRAGITLDPHDPDAWAEAMVAVVGEQELRAALVAAGLKAASELRAEGPQAGALLAAIEGRPVGAGVQARPG